MKKIAVILGMGFFSLSAVAYSASINLLPPITSPTGKNVANPGKITQSDITGSDVIGFLGNANASQWYWSTGNNDRNWGGVNVDVTNQTISIGGMNGTNGAVAGLKVSSFDASLHSGLNFSFDMQPNSANTNFSYSLWYGNNEGTAIELTKGNTNGNGSLFQFSYDVTAEQLLEMAANGNGDIYIVFANKGHDDTSALISNISLTAQAIPEPSTATLSVLALSGLLFRRRR